MKDALFYDAEDVSNILGCSKKRAVQIIRDLNRKAKRNGYFVRPTKVSKMFFNSAYILYEGDLESEQL